MNLRRNPNENKLFPSLLDALELLRRDGGVTAVEAAELNVLDLRKRVSELINDYGYIIDKRYIIHIDHKGKPHRGCKRYIYLGWAKPTPKH